MNWGGGGVGDTTRGGSTRLFKGNSLTVSELYTPRAGYGPPGMLSQGEGD